jgi:hypothetical protein
VSILAKLGSAPQHPDFVDALEVYVEALKARDKALAAFEKADRAAEQRESELEAVIDRLNQPNHEPSAPMAGEEAQ